MIVENSVFINEIATTFSSGKRDAFYRYEATFDLGDSTITPIKVSGIHINREYNQSFADEIVLYVTFPLGKYFTQIYPNKTNLTVNLAKIPLTETAQEELTEVNITTQTYRAILIDKGDLAADGNIDQLQNETDGDRAGFIEVEMQLVDVSLEYIRLKTIGGIIRNAVPGTTLKTLFTKESTNLPIALESKIKGLTMVEPDNTVARKQTVIPHGTKLIDLPNWLQREGGGIYSSGLGCYLQNGSWYIYPEYDTDRFDLARETVSIFNIPPKRFPHVERTYHVSGKSLYILSTGQVKHVDRSENEMNNEGNGVRFTDPELLLNGYSSTKDNTTKLQRGDINTEVVNIERSTGLNNVPVSPSRYNSNIFHEMSMLATRKGQYVQVSWQNSQPELIKPGMPVRFYSYRGDELIQRDGIVVAAEHTISTGDEGAVVIKHSCNSAVSLFLKNIQ